MPYRLFEDSKGTEWQVWDIVPRPKERREAERSDRRVEIKAIAFADRRQTSRRLAAARRAYLRGNFAQGWLCFESQREKRRLSPIPDDWTTCADDVLEEYANEAAPVPGGGRVVTFSGEEPLAEAG